MDGLPLSDGGYYGSIWVGKNRFRYRAIVTDITTPSFLVADGFLNNRIQCYTVIADHFFLAISKNGGLDPDWNTGEGAFGLLKNSVLKDTVGTGYVWKFYKHFYLNPWIAFHRKSYLSMISNSSRFCLRRKPP